MSHHITLPSVDVENTSDPTKRAEAERKDCTYPHFFLFLACFGGREDEFVDWIVVTDLNGRDFHGLGALASVEDG